MASKPKAGKADLTLADLHGDPQNARKHNPRNIGAVQASLQEYGAARSIVIDENNQIIAGHGVVEAAALAGMERVQVVDADGETIIAVRRTGLTKKQKQELGIADNRAGDLSERDGDMLAALMGDVDMGKFFSDEELAELIPATAGNAAADPGPQIDRAAELQAKWGTALGQLWQIGRHRLLVGDCTVAENVARLMGGEKADCVFTSPPYAVGVDYGEEYQDTIDNLRAMLPKLATLWLDVIEPGGFAVVNFGDIAGGRDLAGATGPCEYPMALEYFPVFRAAGWVLWSRRAWCKPNARVNSLWCIGSNRAATDWENIWTFKQDNGEAIVKRVDGEFSSANGWYQSSRLHGVDIGKDDHGAGMALGIAHWMLTVHSRPGAIVHEPFTGTGTTIVACEQLGRSGRGMELSPAYAAVDLERLSGLGLTPELVSNA